MEIAPAFSTIDSQRAILTDPDTIELKPMSKGALPLQASRYEAPQNVDEAVDRLMGVGFKFESMPSDTDWLWREAYLLDPAGNSVCIYHAGQNRRYPPWRIEDGAA